MPRRAATTRTAVLLGGGVLLVGALLARPGTAADDEVLEATRASLDAVDPSPSGAPLPEVPRPGTTTVVRSDGVDGLRLGWSVQEVIAAGYSVATDADGRCRRVLPGVADAGPGPGLSGWLVGERLAAVTIDDRIGATASFLGPGVGGRLDDLPTAGLLRASTPVQVPWQEAPVAVDVAWLRPSPEVRVAFADLTGDGRVDHVQVSEDAALGCAAAANDARAAAVAALPVLDLQGRGDLRVGATLEEAQAVVEVQEQGEAAAAAPDDGPSCRLAMGDDEPGLLYLVVSDAGPGGPVVQGITVDAGRTDAGLAVGEPAERVGEAYPGITTAYLQDRWGQGLSADWQLSGGVLRLWPTREQVPVVEVDAVLRGPRDVVGLIQVGPGC